MCKGDRVGYSLSVTRRIEHQLLGSKKVKKYFKDLGDYPWSRFDIDGIPMPIWACFATTEDGRRVCSGLLVSPGANTEIVSSLLRAIRLGALVTLDSLFLSAGTVKDAKPYSPAKTRPGPAGYPLEHFVLVADAYRNAVITHPKTPLRALARQLNRSEPTVHRWLQRCRREGLLGPSLPGRAGELPLKNGPAK